MSIFDRFRRKRKKEKDEEKEMLERTSKLQTEVKKHVEPTKKKRRKKASV